MAIPQKPPKEQQVQSFIRAASKMEPQTPFATTIRFKGDLVARIDAAAERMGLSRNSWIKYAIAKTLKTDEDN